MNKTHKIWTEYEISFIKDNYPLKGSKYCASELNRTQCSIRNMAKKYNLERANFLLTASEILFVKENYPNNGAEYCATKLNRSKNSIFGIVRKYNLQRIWIKYSKEFLEEYVKKSITIKDLLKNLEISNCTSNDKTIRKYIKYYNIDTSHFLTISQIKKNEKRMQPLEELMVVDSLYSKNMLKKRLYAEGYKKRECEECEQKEIWRGKILSLILDHINGINTDNRLENLRILCPNCNATLDTHCGKNKNRKYKNIVKHPFTS